MIDVEKVTCPEEALAWFENELSDGKCDLGDKCPQCNAYEFAIKALRLLKEASDNPGNISDGYHTFNELYHHRAVLFSVICNTYPELAWKSKRHHDPSDPMYDGMFVVGIETPHGQATYHYNLDPYWDMFHIKELDRAPKWDGHTPAQAIERIEKMGAMQNSPLTLEELLYLVGKPVYLPPPRGDCWALVGENVCGTTLIFYNGEECSAKDWYEQCGKAYRFPLV